MKVELHLHTCRYSLCAIDEPEAMLTACRDLGYELVCLTEHDAVWPDEAIDQLAGQFPELTILPGIERSLRGQHLLILGTNDPVWLEMNEPGAILRAAAEASCLTVLAHPFRWTGGAEMLAGGDPMPDAIEHMTGNQQGPQAANAAAAARARGLQWVNSSDAHATDMLGKFWVETAEPIETAWQLREAIRSGAYENRSL
jgi:predicted metal-dependent phosphoesterase TrpH